MYKKGVWVTYVYAHLMSGPALFRSVSVMTVLYKIALLLTLLILARMSRYICGFVPIGMPGLMLSSPTRRVNAATKRWEGGEDNEDAGRGGEGRDFIKGIRG